jgi:sec-independent protein translocase protein TatC
MRRVKLRLLFVFLAFGVGASLTWLYREPIFLLLYAPADGSLSTFGGLPIYTAPTEAFGVTIGLALKGGLAAAFPVATFSVLTLVSPLLDRKRRRFILWVFTPAFFLCFLGGAAFVYFVMLPAGMRYLLNFGTNIAVAQIRISEYMSLVSALLFWVGVLFELPLVMFLLAKLRLVGYDRFKRFHKYVPIAAFILGAIVTPTFDMVNSTLVAVPVIALFETGLFLSWLVRPGGHPKLARIRAAVCRPLRRVWRVLTAPARWARRGWTWFTIRCLNGKS